MKKIIHYITCAGLAVFLLSSCKKDITETVMKQGVPPVLTASPATIVLTAAVAADTVETLSWTASDYGFHAAVSYTVQIAKAGTNFGSPKEVSMGALTKLKYTGSELNQVALLQGLAPGSAGQLDVRVKSTLTDSLVIFSEKITLTVTPYKVIINYPSLWVPGDYQGWDAASAEKISSKLGNGIYEGYVNIPGGTLQFKYTSEANWDHIIYGWATSTVNGNNVTGTFNTTGGNLFVPSAGYYLLKGNTNDNSWSGTKITGWGVIGDFNSWGGDVVMTYSTATKVWTATVNAAAAGGFKFRANGGWDINFGDTGGDLGLDYNGDNIALTPGSHVVTLDLSVPGNYSYKIQ